ncbi:MAG: hypothetical protein KF770_17555 [Anaerolineae bacterium]|nr:hypothetical protein [Anaerolineae bacterium]
MARRIRTPNQHLLAMIADERETLHSRWRYGHPMVHLDDGQYADVVEHLNTEMSRIFALMRGQTWPSKGRL